MNFFDILLAKQLEGGGGGDVTIEQLDVTENGTYSEPGKAYRPVVVNLPLGEKTITANGTYNASADNLQGYNKVVVNIEGFKLKAMPTGAIATITDAEALPLNELKISVEPVQAGSGAPSPTNIRPITGWTKATITVKDDLTTPTETETYNIDFKDGDNPLTVYGGTVDAINGVLTVDRMIVDLGSLTWTTAGSGRHNATISDAKIIPNTQTANAVCSRYKVVSAENIPNITNSFCVGINTAPICQINDSDLNGIDANDFKTAMEGVQLVYELATPQTYQLTPTAVKSLLGNNNIFADTGDILEGEYFVDL